MGGRQFQYTDKELLRPISPRLRAICSVMQPRTDKSVQIGSNMGSEDNIKRSDLWNLGARPRGWTMEERRGGRWRRAIKIGGGGMHDVCENRRCQLPACQLPLASSLPPSSIAGTRATSPCEDLFALFAQNARRLRQTIAHQLHDPQEREGSPLD